MLFFSSNCYNTDLYDISYATASSISGPYTKAAAPFKVTGDNGLTAPGGLDPKVDGSFAVSYFSAISSRSLTPLLGVPCVYESEPFDSSYVHSRTFLERHRSISLMYYSEYEYHTWRNSTIWQVCRVIDVPRNHYITSTFRKSYSTVDSPYSTNHL